MTVRVSVGKHVTKKSVECVFHPRRLELSVDGQSQLYGSLDDVGEIDPYGCYWYMDESQETESSRCLTLVLLKKTMGYESFSRLLESDVLDTTIGRRVMMTIQIDGKESGVLIFGLFEKAAPNAALNFVALAHGLVWSDGRLDLTNSVFKEIIPTQYAIFGLPDELKREEEFTAKVQMEERDLKHEGVGLLSVDPEKSPSDFMLTFNAMPAFDGKRKVFGKVLHGMELLARIEAQGDDKSGKFKESIVISECAPIGEFEMEALLQEEKKRRIFAAD